MRSFLLAPALFAALTLTLAACSEPAAPTSPAGSASASGAAGPATITVYTSEPQNKMDQLVAAFKKARPEITVKVFRAATGDLKTRIESERTTGKVGADVLLAADVPTFEGLKANSLFAKYTPADASKLRQDVLDKDGYYVGTRIIPTVLMYNTKQITDAPTSWAELTDARYKGKLVMPNPEVSGAAAYNMAVWLQNPALGEPWLKGVAANQPVIADSNGPASQAVAQGSQPVGIVVDYLVRDLAAAGSPVAVSYPTEGAPYITEPAAVFKDSQAPQAAQAFVDFLVSAEGQKLAVQQNYLPVRSDAGQPSGVPANVKLMEVDPLEITKRQKPAIATYKEIFGK